jgi:hypothetical protein
MYVVMIIKEKRGFAGDISTFRGVATNTLALARS